MLGKEATSLHNKHIKLLRPPLFTCPCRCHTDGDEDQEDSPGNHAGDGPGDSEEEGHHIQAAGNPGHMACGGSDTEHSHVAEDRADWAEAFQN